MPGKDSDCSSGGSTCFAPRSRHPTPSRDPARCLWPTSPLILSRKNRQYLPKRADWLVW